MKLHNILDEVLKSKSHIMVLRVLQDTAQGYTGREIARLSGLTHRACLQALTNLEDLAIVQRRRGGRDHTFTLNRKNVIVSDGILPLLDLERKLLDRLQQYIKRRFAKHTESIMLFGSVVRGEETVGSDMDVCFVAGNKSKLKEVENIVHELQPAVKQMFGADLAPVYYTAAEFKKYYMQDKSPVVDIVHEGKRISGSSVKSLINAEKEHT